MQSLAQEIKSFSKTNLRKQCTRVTTLSGRRIIETWKGSTVHVVEDTVQPETPCGYIQDNTWDLQVGYIRPYLLLGSQDAAHDFGTLKKYKVTHILNVAYGVENAFSDLFIYKTLSILDLPDTDIISHLHECAQFIDQAKAEKGVVLVHCNTGVSRSASVVIGYLMWREGQSFDDAFSQVKSLRPASCPNPGFIDQLKNFKPQCGEGYYLWEHGYPKKVPLSSGNERPFHFQLSFSCPVQVDWLSDWVNVDLGNKDCC